MMNTFFYNISKNKNIAKHFYFLCTNGCYDEVKYIYNLYCNDLYITDPLFYNICIYGSYDIVKFLYSLNNKLHITDNLFSVVCRRGRIDVAKFLYSINNNLIINKEFLILVMYNTIDNDIGKWIFSLNTNLKITELDIELFNWCCYNGHINKVKFMNSQCNKLMYVTYISPLKRRIIIHLQNDDITVITSFNKIYIKN